MLGVRAEGNDIQDFSLHYAELADNPIPPSLQLWSFLFNLNELFDLKAKIISSFKR